MLKLLILYDPSGDNEIKARDMTAKFVQKTKQQVNVALNSMKVASRTMWRCDPRNYQEHVTYEQLTRLLQVLNQS